MTIVDETFQDEMRREVEACQKMAQSTGNPLYAWLALSALSAAREEQGGLNASEEPLILPAWCAEIIGSAATKLHAVISGHDILDRDQQKPLTPARAAQLLPAALDITRPGFNAFRDVRARFMDARWKAMHEQLMSEGHGWTAAMEIISKQRNKEISGTRKRIRRATPIA